MWIAATLDAAARPANRFAQITLTADACADQSRGALPGTSPADPCAEHRPAAQAVPNRDGQRRNPGRCVWRRRS